MYRVREMFYGTREAFDYVECPSCHCLQIASIPDDVSRYYPEKYYAYSILNEQSFGIKMKAFLRRQRNRYLLFRRGGLLGSILCRLYPPDYPFRLIAGLPGLERMAVLDVGCGAGRFLYQLKEAGIERAHGIDPYIEHDITYKDGLVIAKLSLANLQHDNAMFDLIMFNHSFEHMPDPGAVLQTTAAMLAAAGTIMMRMPTVDSYAWEHYRENWVQLDAPRHLYLHSRSSIEMLAEKAGLEVTDVIYDSDAFQFWGSEQYLMDIPLEAERSFKGGLDRSIFSKGQISEFQKRSEELNAINRGDMAAYYLRKVRGENKADST